MWVVWSKSGHINYIRLTPPENIHFKVSLASDAVTLNSATENAVAVSLLQYHNKKFCNLMQ